MIKSWRLCVGALTIGFFLTGLFVGFAPPAAAHSWSHYRRIWNASNDRYGAYAWLDADERVDYIHVRFRVSPSGDHSDSIRDETVYCGPASEGCGYRRTPSVYWGRRTRWIQHFHCGYDRTPAGYVHKFKGQSGEGSYSTAYPPCSQNGLYTHIHDYYYP